MSAADVRVDVATVGRMATGEVECTAEHFLDGFPDELKLHTALEASARDIGDASVHVTKSQIAFRRRNAFAYLWRPEQYVNGAVPEGSGVEE